MQPPVKSLTLRETIRADGKAFRLYHSGFFWTLFFLMVNPGFLAVFLYRLSAACAGKEGRIRRWSALIIWRFNIFVSGCDIAPLAKIGPGLLLPHPLCIVIGPCVVVGRNATILHNVTLGQRDPRIVSNEDSPGIGDNVLIAAGAVICGKITIGDNAVIGANAVVLQDIPDNAMAVGIPAAIKDKKIAAA